MKKVLICLIILIGFIPLSHSQSITGLIIDGEFDDPLPFANVVVEGQTIGTTSDFDGKYNLQLAAGTYSVSFSFVGYETKIISDVVVSASGDTIIDVILNPSSNQLQEVVVTTTAKRNSETSVLNIQKKSINLLDGLSIQSIRKAGDSDVAGAIKRVPGVTVQEGKFVYVRGLGDRYTKTLFNGMEVPGLDPDRNTLQLDILPTNLIDNILVKKSYSADLPADFTGGIVDVKLKGFSESPKYSISYSIGYNPNMHLNDNFIKDHNSKTDWLGYDNGLRDNNVYFEDYDNQSINNEEIINNTKKLNNNFGVVNAVSDVNYSLSMTASNSYGLSKDLNDNRRIGYIAAIGYKNETTFNQNFYRGTTILEDQILQDFSSISGDEGIQNRFLSGLFGLSYRGKKSSYTANFLYLQNGQSTAIDALYKEYIENPYTAIGNTILYNERSIRSIPVAAKYILREGALKIDWAASYTKAGNYDKDNRQALFRTNNSRTRYYLTNSGTNWPIKIWRTLDENVYNAKFNLQQESDIGSVNLKLKLGGAFTKKERDFGAEYNVLFFNRTSRLLGGDFNLILAEDSIRKELGGSGAYVQIVDNPTNRYNAKSETQSAYISNEIKFSEKIRGEFGLRLEAFKIFYSGIIREQGYRDINQNFLNLVDLFPSANIVFTPIENINVRFSYTKTTARPSFKEISTANIYDPIGKFRFYGNPDLRPTYINNFDFRVEKFWDKNQILAVSFYKKDFKNPIETVNLDVYSPIEFTPKNNEGGEVKGIEIESRINVIDNDRFLINLGLNSTFISSKFKMTEEEIEGRKLFKPEGDFSTTRELQGQSPYNINSSVVLTNLDTNIELALYYNVQGPTLFKVGLGQVPEVYTLPFHSLNGGLKIPINEKSDVTIKANNLLNSRRVREYDWYGEFTNLYSLITPGTSFSIGYSLKF